MSTGQPRGTPSLTTGPAEHGCRSRRPAGAAAVHRPQPRDGRRTPRVLTLTPTQAADLPHWLPRLLAGTGPTPGARVTVDLGGVSSVHLSGLALLLIVLWRRVGPHGEIVLSGGTRGLRAQLVSVGVTPAACRALVHGQPTAPPRDMAPATGLVGAACSRSRPRRRCHSPAT